MLIKKTSKLNEQLTKLNPPITTCKVCFKDMKQYSFRTLFNDVDECDTCFNMKEPIFQKFITNGVKGLAIYPYDETLKSRIFQLKGNFDIELANSFLGTYANALSLIFYNYYVVYVPSYEEDNKLREFNHVEEIFRPLKLKKLDLLIKTEHHKQSDQKFKDRKLIKNYLKLKNNEDLQGKRILIVDDIYTTGSTINACIDLIKSLHPKSIKVLVLCKVQGKEENE